VTVSAIRGLLEEGIDHGFFAGAAAVVLEESAPLLELYMGDARVEPQGERFSASATTLWDLGALTKPLAGAATLLAMAEGHLLSLDDPLRRFGDLYKKTKFEGVTLRGLLAHSAGLPAWYPSYVRGEGRAAYRRTLAALDMAAPPGRTVAESCPGYLLLAEVAERALGAELDRFFRERIARPLGLGADLLFALEGEDVARAAGGERDDATERRRVAERGLSYVGFRRGVVNGQPNDGNAYRRAAGVSLNAGLFGTARATAAAGAAWLLRDGRLLRESSIEDAIANATRDREEDRGLGWQLATTKGSPGDALSARAFGHTSPTGSSLFVDPEARRVFVLLTNPLHPDARASDMDAFRRRFHEAARSVSG
jgi:CubicO group peptidase (beta-lactamase class C family)